MARNNPFGLVILAHLAALERFPDDRAKLSRKLYLTAQLYEHGWSKSQVVHLFRFIDWLIRLPEAIDIEYAEEIKRIEGKNKMQYITSVERVGIQKGELSILERQIQRKFHTLPENYRQRLAQANSAVLLDMAERVLEADSLEALFDEE